MNKKNDKWLWLFAFIGSVSRSIRFIIELILIFSDKKSRQELYEERKLLLMFLFLLLLPFIILLIMSFFFPLDPLWEIIFRRKYQIH